MLLRIQVWRGGREAQGFNRISFSQQEIILNICLEELGGMWSQSRNEDTERAKCVVKASASVGTWKGGWQRTMMKRR